MSGYTAFPSTPPRAARWLTDHYGLPVSESKVRRVFDLIGDGLRAPDGTRLIYLPMLDAIMAQLEAEGYVFSEPQVREQVASEVSPEPTLPPAPAVQPKQPQQQQHQAPGHTASNHNPSNRKRRRAG